MTELETTVVLTVSVYQISKQDDRIFEPTGMILHIDTAEKVEWYRKSGI